MEIDKNEDELEALNRLLEQLHRADYRVLGSIEINIYKPGSQHVDKVENQYNTQTHPGLETHPGPPKPHPLTPSPTGEGERPRGGELPEVLATDEAMALWEKVQAAGYVDEHYQPLLSRTLSAILADEMAVRLGIREKWKVFETLWHRRNMYRDYYKALDLQQTLTFRDKLRRIIR